jgi:hypothetical protein
LSVDPLAPSYPWYTPYQFAGNGPIANVDLDGLEPLQKITASSVNGDGTPVFDIADDWVVVTATKANTGQLHGSGPIARNARNSPHTDVIGNLSSNVPTNGATGYAGEVANSALLPIAGVGVGVAFAGAAGMYSGAVVMPALPSAASMASFASTIFKITSEGAISRFLGDGASQFVFSMARDESFLKNYNVASGLSSAFANPFVGAFVAGSVNVSYNNPLDINLARGVGSSLIGGTLGYTAGRVLGPTIKGIKPLHSWKGGYGETFKINPIKHIFGAVPPAFTKGPAKFFPDLNEFNHGNVNLKEFDNSDK